MLKFKKDYCLKKHNTFSINAKAKYFAAFNTIIELNYILKSEIYTNNKTLVLGEGSNILFTKDFDGLIIQNKIDGINILKENKENVIVEVGAGVNWHTLVQWSIKHKLSGIENLALIPGTVGASPVQNIGAYGMEVKDSITKVHALELKNGACKVYQNKECKFSYRSSVFKTELKNKIIITKVEFRFSKIPLNKTSYGEIKKELKSLKLSPSPKHIANAIINIRSRKLPNPKKIPNTGSFFKNPIISTKKFNKLAKVFPGIVGYKISDQKTKVAAGWLIENAGLKGYRENDAGIHKKQALVLVNYGNASGLEILKLAKKIQKNISNKYAIKIEPEVNII